MLSGTLGWFVGFFFFRGKSCLNEQKKPRQASMFQSLTPQAVLTSTAALTSAEVLHLLWLHGFCKVLSLVLSLQNFS